MVVDSEIESLRAKITALTNEHHDLDGMITKMCESQVYSDNYLHDLKKKKLYLKDQIAMLERRLSP